MSEPAPRHLSFRRRLLYGGIVAVLGVGLCFGLLEGGLRAIGYGYTTRFFREVESADGNRYWRENRDFTAPWFSPERVRRPPPFQLEAEKRPDSYRIFVLGSSAAMGDPEASFSIARMLERMLGEAYPEIHFEVVNAAITAVNSHVVRHVAADCAALGPDLFIVYEGNNEVIGPFGPAGVFAPFFESPQLISVVVGLRQSRTGQLIGELARALARRDPTLADWGGMGMFLDHRISADDPRLGTVRAHFARNLAAIARSGQRAGAATILCTVPANQRDFAPFFSAHRVDLTSAERERWQAAVDTGDNALGSGDNARAERHYLEAAFLDDSHAGLAFRLGRLALAADDIPAARHFLTRGLDLDTLRFRTDSPLNETIRAVAESAPGAELLDLANVLAAENRDGLIGDEFLYEHVHLNFPGAWNVASLLFERTSADLVRRGRIPAQRPQTVGLDTMRRRLAFTAYEQAMIARELLARFQAPPFTAQMDHAIRLATWEQRRAAADRLLAQPGTSAALGVLYEEALATAPDDWMLARNYGMMLVAQGAPGEALSWLEQAQTGIDDDPDTLFALATAYQAEGEATQAAVWFARLRRLEPRYPGLPPPGS